MNELLIAVADMHRQATKMKDMIVALGPSESDKLREALHELKTAIYVMERAAADAYRAKEAL